MIIKVATSWYSKCLVFNKNLQVMQRKKKTVGPRKKKWTETVSVEAQILDLLDKGFKSSLKYAQRDKGSHVQRNKENDENDILLNRQYE